MKCLTPLAAILLLFTSQNLLAQTALDSELERLQQASAKGNADLTVAETAQIAASKTAYLQALQAADQQATAHGKVDALNDIIAEKTALAEKGILPATPGAALPKNLSSRRASYSQALLRAAKAYDVRQKQFLADHLRALGALEARAKAANNAALLEKLAAEKTRLLSGAPAVTSQAVQTATSPDGAAGHPQQSKRPILSVN